MSVSRASLGWLAFSVILTLCCRLYGQTTDYVAKYSSSGTTNTSAPIFDHAGNVGIGTTNPLRTLDVNGDIRIEGGGWGFRLHGVAGELQLRNDQDSAQLNLHVGNFTADGNSVIGTTSTTTTIRAVTGLGPGWYNNIVQNNDAAIIYDINNAFSSGALVIAPHANATSGLRFDSSGNITSFSTMFLMSNVGIGTTSPSHTLEVNGNVAVTGSGGSITYPDGTTQSTAWTGSLCGGDYAESVDVTGDRHQYGPGDVLQIDEQDPSRFERVAERYSNGVAGVFSTRPGAVGRRQTTPKSPDELPLAIVGIVPVKVTAENGPIHPRDLLVSSSRAGYAMKGTDRNKMLGAVIGKAMGSLDKGEGVIEVLVTLQ